MANTFSEEEPVVVRMTADDRQAINRMIQHKRQEFESVMKKGIVAMLNAQEEHDKLTEKRTEYLSFLSLKTQRKKADLNQITTEARSLTQGVPMGISTGVQIALGGANAVGQAILNEGEQRRQEQEAEQNLYSAQMLYYIPPQDYEPIAERVAVILSYRYQFLIFRLASGEKGYIKLANFFLKSMKNYAISRLREQKNNVISALINAAIPPSTDSLSYRDFPSIDLANFRINLRSWGKRSILALDDEANEIVKRCGPAVRTLVGGCESYVDQSALKIQPFNDYTILGALNHAPIVNGAGRVMAGLQTAHRQLVSLDGNMKYPMILLGQDETTAHLGVNFATRTTDYSLESVHQEALKRLVPVFHEYQACYKLRNPIDSRLKECIDSLRYPEERKECPWTKRRDDQLHSRLLSVYASAKKSTVTGEIQEIEGISKLQAMLKAGHIDALALQREELKASRQTLLDAVRLLFNNELPESTQKRQRIQVLNKAKYGGKAVTQMLNFMLAANSVSPEDFAETKRLLELVHLSIYACRGNLIQETLHLDEVLNANAKAKAKLEQISLSHQFAFNNVQLLIELLQAGDLDEQSSELLQRDDQINQRMIKNLKVQLRDNIAALKKMREVSDMIAVYDMEYAKTAISLDEATAGFDAALQHFRQTHQLQHQQVSKKMSDFFYQILFDANFYYQELKEATRQEGCIFIENSSWADGLLLQDRTSAEKKERITQAIELWFSDLKTLCQTAQNHLCRYSRWSTNKVQIDLLLQGLKDQAINKRDKIIASYHSLSYQSEFHKDMINTYLLKAKQQDELSCLYFLAHDSGCDLQILANAAKRLYLSYQQVYAETAKNVAEDMVRGYERISRDISWQELKQKVTIVRRAKENLELEIRDDIELMELAYNQLHLVQREAMQVEQDISDINAKITYFREHYEFFDSLSFTNEKYLALVNEKVDAILENIGLFGLDKATFADFITSEKEKFNLAWMANPNKNTLATGVFFLAKLLGWVNEKYFSLYPLDTALRTIKLQKEKVSVLVNQEPLEFLIARKKALRAVKYAYGQIQKTNQWIEQDGLGIRVPNPIKKSDLARDILIWSRSLSLHEREWLDFKNATISRREEQHTRDYKTPVRMVYSFLLAMLMDQVMQKRTELARLRKIQNQVLKFRIGQFSAESSLASGRTSMSELKKEILGMSRQMLPRFDSELEHLLVLKHQMLEKSKTLFFTEWKRKVFDLPPDDIFLKKKLDKLEKKKIYKPVSELKKTLPDDALEEENEIEFSLDDLEEKFEILNQYILVVGQDDRKSPRKSSAYSMFAGTSNSSEESLEQKTVLHGGGLGMNF